jgi:hypothetical protein
MSDIVERLDRRLWQLEGECYMQPGETMTDRAGHAAALSLDLREARDEIARLRVRLAVLDGPTGAVEQWRNEAETNRQGYLKAVARAEQAEARVAKLEGALRAVEWCDVDGSVFCPWCEVSGFNGCVEHALDCPRQAALSAPGQPEGER